MISINMLSKADSVEGQGVGSAYLEQVNLVKSSNKLDISVNKKGKFDICHIHTVNPTYYLRMRFGKAKYVTYCHFLPKTLDESIKLPKPIFAVFKKYVVNFYKKSDKLIVVNPIFIEDLVELGIKRDKIKYIPNFVSDDNFYEMENKQELKEKYGLTNRFVVLSVGQLQTRKGVLDFVEIAKKMPNIDFVWAGGFSFGKITDGYKEIKEVYDNPPKNVKFLGIVSRDEMNEIYNMADLFFLASFNELFPMSILEAVSAKTPILLRDLDLYEKILFSPYAKASDIDGFVREIEKLQDETNYKLAVETSETINEYYKKEKVLEYFEDFYEKTLKEL